MKKNLAKIRMLVLGGLAAFGPTGTSAVTAGWENVNPERKEFPLAKVVWTASPETVRLEKFDGAEGELVVSNGLLHIRKTNDRGFLRVEAPAMKLPVGREIRLSADVVHCRTRSIDRAEGGLCVSTDGRTFPERDQNAHHWFYAGGHYMRRMINTAPGMSYRKYTHARSATGEVIPAIFIRGAASESVWKNWCAEDLDEAQKLWNRHVEEMRVPDRRPERQPLAAFEKSLAADSDHTAEIRTVHGRSVLFVDGRPTPPILYKESHMFYPPPDQVIYAGKPAQRAGLRLGVIEVVFGGDTEKMPATWTKEGFDVAKAVERIRNAMRIGDESVFLLALELNAYPEFTAEHPDETWRREDGSVVCGTFYSASRDYDVGGDHTSEKKTWPWVSYASRAYRAAIVRNLEALVAELKRTGLSKRIVGFHLTGFHDGQFAMPFPDYSKCTTDEYARYLAEENPGPEFEYFSVQTGFRTLEHFARALKRLFGKPIIGVRWCMAPFAGLDGAFDLTAFAHSDALDVIVPQTAYLQRQPALATSDDVPVATLHDNRKMLWLEFDHRNYAALDTWAKSVYSTKGLGHAEDDAQWETIDRKHHGYINALGMGAWYYDMGGGWLRTPRILRELEDVLKVRRDLMAKEPDPWRPDVVWVIDERAMCLYNRRGFPKVDKYGVWKMVNGAREKFGGSGVPYEIRLADDFVRKPDLIRHYKAAVLAGFVHPDPNQRRMIADFKAKGAKVFVEPVAGVTSEGLNAFARSAGAFVAADAGTQVNMNGDFMSLHAILPGPRRISLPFAARVVNLKDGREEAADATGFDVDLSAGETCWFRLYRKK